MVHSHKHHYCREENKKSDIGIFFVVLGLALLIVKTDLFNLGSSNIYYCWEAGLVFVGTILLLKLRFVLGFLMIASGVWFFVHNMNLFLPNNIELFYWPVVIFTTGLLIIISFLLKKPKAK